MPARRLIPTLHYGRQVYAAPLGRGPEGKLGTCSACGRRVALVQSARTSRWYLCDVTCNPARAAAHHPHQCDPEGIEVMNRYNAAKETAR